ncbi:unnamed protein product [Bathycoccus prasinos]
MTRTDDDDGKKTLESHFHLSKSRVNDAVSTLEKTILETAKKRERELSEKKTLIDRLYERLELTREMVAEGEKQLTESEMKLQKAKEENEMLRKVVEECTKKSQLALVCDAMVKGSDVEEVGVFDSVDDNEEYDYGERQKLRKDDDEVNAAEEEKQNEYVTIPSNNTSSSRIQTLVKTLSKSVRNLESAVQKERSYRKMADAEVEKARKCIMNEVEGENADLKIAAARLTKALSLLKHSGESCSSTIV